MDHQNILIPLLSRLQDDTASIEFNLVYPDEKYQAVQIELWRLREYPNEALGNILRYAQRTGCKVSFSPNSRRVNAKKVDKIGLPWDGFATKEEVIECSSAFVDADRKAGAVDIRELIDFRPQPTIVVQSSQIGKYHAYWEFRHSLPIEGYEDIAKYEAVNRGLCNALNLDVPMDIRRVMRLPGSLNTKYDPPLLCKVVYYNPDNLYDDYSQFPMAELSGNFAKASTWQAEVVGHEKLTPLQYQSVVDQVSQPQKFGGRSNCLYAVAKWLRDIGLSATDTDDLFSYLVTCYAVYRDFPDKDRENAVKSAYRS